MLFDNKPADFNDRYAIPVVLCLVEAESQILLLQRRADIAERQAGRWGIPGGTLEEYEPRDAVWRELGEETGLWLENKTDLGDARILYARYTDPDGIGQIDFTFYLFRLSLPRKPEIKLNRDEHIAFCWIPAKAALHMHLVRDQDEFLKLCYPVKEVIIEK